MRNLKFGIELEVATRKSREEVIEALENAGINVKGSYYGSPVNYNSWKVQPDSSINGWEIVSPPLTDFDELKTVVYILRKVLKVRCNRKTGLHIHHDISDFNIAQIKNLYRLYNKYESNAIYSIINPSRRENWFCGPISSIMEDIEKTSNIEEFKNIDRYRYYNLNHKSFIKYGTIEFRHHQGTTDINEIIAWIKLTHKLVETAENLQKMTPIQSKNNEEALDEMIEEIGLSNNKLVVRQLKKEQRYVSKIS